MRVLIDATPLLLRSAGVKTYVYHWLTHLQKLSGPDEIRGFPFLSRPGTLDHERSVAGWWSTFPRLAALHALNHFDCGAMDWMAEGADIFHASNQVHNPPRRKRLTATLYDVTCWKMPELHTAGNVKAETRFAERVLRQADALIAISESTRQDAIQVLGLEPEKIEVIHCGVERRYFEATSDAGREVARGYGVKRPYILFVGTIEPRKNVDLLLDAYGGLPAAVREEFELVLAGPAGWQCGQTLARMASMRAGVRYLGYVAEQDLPGLTAGAAVFVYPSLYEGFGLPVAQAMAAGVPVITSAVSSLPEVAGEGALLIDPRSADGLRDALERLLLSPSLREILGSAGRVRAGRYRWESCAAKSLEFFRRISG